MKIVVKNVLYDCIVDEAHFNRRLGVPSDYDFPETILENVNWAKDWYANNGQPWLNIFEIVIECKDQLKFNNINIESSKILKRFKKYDIKKGLILLATAGEQVDKKTKELWSSDPDKSFYLDAYASSITESLIHKGVEIINNWVSKKGMNALARYSPGYPGWELMEQKKLLKIIKATTTDSIPIDVSDSALLYPLKSQISVIGIHQHELKTKPVEPECVKCSFYDCACRNNKLLKK